MQTANPQSFRLWDFFSSEIGCVNEWGTLWKLGKRASFKIYHDQKWLQTQKCHESEVSLEALLSAMSHDFPAALVLNVKHAHFTGYQWWYYLTRVSAIPKYFSAGLKLSYIKDCGVFTIWGRGQIEQRPCPRSATWGGSDNILAPEWQAMQSLRVGGRGAGKVKLLVYCSSYQRDTRQGLREKICARRHQFHFSFYIYIFKTF